jgi:hypothetical protein
MSRGFLYLCFFVSLLKKCWQAERPKQNSPQATLPLTLVRETLFKKYHWKGTFTGRAKYLKVMAYLEGD